MKNKGYETYFFWGGEGRGQIKCIMGNVEVAYWPGLWSQEYTVIFKVTIAIKRISSSKMTTEENK